MWKIQNIELNLKWCQGSLWKLLCRINSWCQWVFVVCLFSSRSLLSAGKEKRNSWWFELSGYLEPGSRRLFAHVFHLSVSFLFCQLCVFPWALGVYLILTGSYQDCLLGPRDPEHPIVLHQPKSSPGRNQVEVSKQQMPFGPREVVKGQSVS